MLNGPTRFVGAILPISNIDRLNFGFTGDKITPTTPGVAKQWWESLSTCYHWSLSEG